MSDAFSTNHLDLHESGNVYLRAMPNACLFDTISLGFVGWHCWPEELGAEPDWLWPELLQCWDWYDAVWAVHERPRRSDRAEVLSWCHP